MSLAIMAVEYHVEMSILGNLNLNFFNNHSLGLSITNKGERGMKNQQASVFQSKWLFTMHASKRVQLNAIKKRALEKQREVIYSC